MNTLEKQITHGSLFSGIGGFDLAAERVGWKNIFQVERDEWCRKILDQNFKGVEIYGDIKEFNGEIYKGNIDVISGGFPCQPFSKAGSRKGKEDDRFIWHEMLRVIQEVEPNIVVAENVANIDGMALSKVLNDLESSGYETLPPLEIEAASVGLFTRRNRVWIIGVKENSLNTNTDCIRSYRAKVNEQRKTKLPNEQISVAGQMVSECIRNGTNPRVFRDANGIPHRVDRIKGVGNAIAPKVAYNLFININQLLKELKVAEAFFSF